MSFLPGDGVGPPQVAYAISRKVGNAVRRNRIRRQLRAIAHELAPTLRPGMYLIGVAPSSEPVSFARLRSIAGHAMDQASAEEASRRSRTAS